VQPIGALQGVVEEDRSGRAHRTPLLLQQATVQAVVHQVLNWKSMGGRPQYGILLQNTRATADADDRTSDGLHVYLADAPVIEAGREDWRVRVGDELVLTGTVAEFQGFTQLRDARVLKVVRREVDLDAELETPEVNPPTDAEAADRYWERREGMRVRLPADLRCVSGRHHQGRNDDAVVWVVRADSPVGGRANAVEQRVFRDAHPLDDQPAGPPNGNGFRFALSSQGIKALQGPDAYLPPYRSFDRLSGPVTGGVIYTFGTYQVAPVAAPAAVPGPGPDQLCPPRPPQRPALVVASYNLENLYDTRNDPSDPCDAHGDPGNESVTAPFDYLPDSEQAYRARLRLFARQIVEDLHAPDILLVQEVEDQDICLVRDGGLVNSKRNHADGEIDALQDLALAIRTLGGPRYATAADRRGADARGIICGFLFRPDRVSLAPATEADPVLGSTPKVVFRTELFADTREARNPKAFNAQFTPVDSGDNDPPQVYTRAAQVARFLFWPEAVGQGTPQSVLCVVNHFSSRPDKNVVRRTHQAGLSAAVARAELEDNPLAAVVVGGDLNVFPRPDDPVRPPSDQLRELYASGLRNAYDTALAECPAGAYSYVFSGEAGTLDHLFLSESLWDRLRQARYLHLNADWPSPRPDDTPRGASDHEPLWLELAP
jgi:predicted extracellular nuclease